jgi:hypothetical protein
MEPFLPFFFKKEKKGKENTYPYALDPQQLLEAFQTTFLVKATGLN